VVTDRTTYTADALVFTAGSWNGQLMPWLHGLATPELQVPICDAARAARVFQPESFPVFNCLVDEGRFYGFPVFGVPGFKFGKYHHLEEQGRPDQIRRGPSRADEELLREFAGTLFSTGHRPDPDAQGMHVHQRA
jgi:sarcosine oxidase